MLRQRQFASLWARISRMFFSAIARLGNASAGSRRCLTRLRLLGLLGAF